MKTHTANFKNAIKLHGRELDSLITYTINQEEIELGPEQLNSVTPHYQGNILKSVMKQIDIESTVEIPVGTEINYQFGLKVNGVYEYLDFGNYIVYSIQKKEDTNSYLITAYDKMLYSMTDYRHMNITYPITIRDYINTIATTLGLTFKNNNETFANYNREIQQELYLSYNEDTGEWESLDYTFRDVLDELSQVTAGTICINKDDQLEIRYITPTSDTIDEEYLKNVNVEFGESYGPVNTIVLSRSADSDKVYKSYPDNLPDEDKIAIEIKDNQIMNWNDRSDYLPDILNKLLGLEYSLNDYSSTGIVYYDLCDKYNVQVGETSYSCIMLNDEINITQGLYENIYTERPEDSETDYTKADKTDRRINQTYLIVDKQNQQISSVITNVGIQDRKISRIDQKVDELTSQISDVADLTTSGESSYASIDLDRINESEPIMIKVRPTGTNISYLYPRNNLYPSDTLYMSIRTIRFHNDTTGTNIDYELPDDLLYYDSENYDEFYLDFESQTCQITKKCKYNADGSVGLLSETAINSYTYPYIPLEEGDYTISIYGYNYGYIFARLMSQNLYTSQFYTKAETNSLVDQKASEITLSVNTTLSNYSTTAQMNSAINLKANEITSSVSETYATKTTTNSLSSRISQTAKSIALSVNNGSTSSGLTITTTKEDGTTATATGTISMNGLVSFTNLSTSGQTTINGGNITTGTISSNRLESNVITTSNLSSQTISANQITTGSMSANRITTGTLNGTNVNITNINASNIKTGKLSGTYIQGGTISGTSFNVTGSNAITVYGSDNLKDAELNRYGLYTYNDSGTFAGKVTATNVRYNGTTYPGISMVSPDESKSIMTFNYGSQVKGDLYVTGNVYPSSYKKIKKNIKLYNESVLEKIVNTDVYSYNYKTEANGEKKHLGFIIDPEYRTPEEIKRKEGVDLYSISAMLWKGMQEQQKQIEELKKEIEKLKEDKVCKR